MHAQLVARRPSREFVPAHDIHLSLQVRAFTNALHELLFSSPPIWVLWDGRARKAQDEISFMLKHTEPQQWQVILNSPMGELTQDQPTDARGHSSSGSIPKFSRLEQSVRGTPMIAAFALIPARESAIADSKWKATPTGGEGDRVPTARVKHRFFVLELSNPQNQVKPLRPHFNLTVDDQEPPKVGSPLYSQGG